jgi:fucose permease
LEAKGARPALAGFFVSGLLLSFLGAILPAWGYHYTEQYIQVGNYFVAFNSGLFLSNRLAERLLLRAGIRWCLIGSCLASCVAMLWLAWFSPPYTSIWRLPGLFVLGAGAGLLHSAIFQAIAPIYRHDRAATVNIAGIFFGLGCLSMALLVAGTYYVYNVPSILVILAVIPGFFAAAFGRTAYDAPVVKPPAASLLADFRSPIAIQFGLLLLLQFANEWSIAGWLAIFVTQRLGINPSTSLFYLALYWIALLIGRVVAQRVLTITGHGKILFAGTGAALLGCAILSLTDNRFGVVSGILFLGAGFAPVYPLIVEQIGDKFPYYDPVFYHGIFSLAFTGALLAPAALGYLASWQGVRWIMVFPLVGSSIVFFLLLVLWIESRLSKK